MPQYVISIQQRVIGADLNDWTPVVKTKSYRAALYELVALINKEQLDRANIWLRVDVEPKQ